MVTIIEIYSVKPPRHRGLLLDIVENGLLFNAYNTPVETLHGLGEVELG
jgi:hypothetical protein